ncbi:hypothetical protein A9Z42_0091090 [Trichoderma parareesei]|uniref:UbiA prenyltransferase n=1 Tax=Trichoderma parareesei TaxID=858221 RepID=A0A2H2ZYT6_TRIPA|nr:hypothetical protein A9Z42_0091090 [Trichoderma parareesei]
MAFYNSKLPTKTGPLQKKSKTLSKHAATLKAMSSSLLLKTQHEMDVTIRLLKSNAVGFAFISISGLLTRAILSPMSMTETTLSTFKVLMIGFLCNYIFDIANQASSPLEDYLNKPYRPIPAGLISLDQARARWIISWTLGLIIIYSCFGPWAALHLLHFEILIWACYVWPRWKSWFIRNYFAAAAYFMLSRLLAQVLRASSPNRSFAIDTIIFFWLMATIHIQEFHDLEGDRKSNRKTLPMVLSDKGLKTLRSGTSIFIIAFGSGILLVGGAKMAQDILVVPTCVLQQVLSCVLAYRISASDSVEMDKATYHIYYYPSLIAILLSLVTIVR